MFANKMRRTRTPYLLDYKVPFGVYPLVPQLPKAWLGPQALAKQWGYGYKGYQKLLSTPI